MLNDEDVNTQGSCIIYSANIVPAQNVEENAFPATVIELKGLTLIASGSCTKVFRRHHDSRT